MKLKQINVQDTIKNVQDLLKEEQNISSALKAAIELLLWFVSVLANRFKLTSDNSSTPPSSDINRKRGSKKKKSDKKAGGQKGHAGCRLGPVSFPDEIKTIELDKRTLPLGNYLEDGYESRQVIDIRISKWVTEYRAQILKDERGNRYVAPFPSDVKSDVQYGNQLKSHAVYLSQFQLLPYQRIQDYFCEQMKTPLSAGTLFNFNQEAYELLEAFDGIAKQRLINSPVIQCDETGININKDRYWLHTTSNPLWTYFYPHEKRGHQAMDAIGILPNFKGTLCHDHWKTYYRYSCLHSLCNAHHLRELEYAKDNDKQVWAEKMQQLLITINQDVTSKGGSLPQDLAKNYRLQYRQILDEGDLECPPPDRPPGKKGRLKQSKSRNLLVRLRQFEEDTLRFMEEPLVPFTNNLSENDLRMTKVQQKISGCFRSIQGAYIFCRIRSYLSTCRKHNISSTLAMQTLFHGKLPQFITAE